MKVEYDAIHDLLYVWFAPRNTRAARTDVIAPGVHADFDSDGRLVGIEVLEASKTIGPSLNVEIPLAS